MSLQSAPAFVAAADPMSLSAAFDQLREHGHLCSLYDTQEESYAVSIPFVRLGLERKEKCLYIAEDETLEVVTNAMIAGGIDVEQAIDSKDLVLTTKEQTYLKKKTFDPNWILTFWKQATNEALSQGYSALRAAGDTEWVSRGGKGLERWLEYESRVNHTLAGISCFALCQYNRNLFPPELVLDIIRTHPIVIYRGHVCRNMYYVPPEELLQPKQPEKEVERLLSNIQEREQVEHELRLNEQRFRTMIEEVKEYAIFTLDPDGRVSSWNAGAQLIKGYRAEEIVGRHVSVFYPSEARGQAEADLKLAAEHGKLEREDWRIRKDGSQFWSNVVTTAMHDPRGRLIGFSKIVRDLTERNRAEEAIQVTRTQMAHIARVKTLGELTASIAHEINQPLSAVVTLGSAALRWLNSRPPDLPEACEAISRGVSEANRAAEVIAGVRALAKKAEPAKTSLDINEAIREVLALTEIQTDKNHILVQTELAHPLPPVSGSKVELQQVILNLVSNSIDAMTSIPDRPRVLLVRSELDERGVVVTVRDSGIGIPPERMDNIFDAFFTTKPAGMGMGLSISRSIIEAHDGRLWATPNPSGGMTFQFALAAAAESAARLFAAQDGSDIESGDPARGEPDARRRHHGKK